MRRIVILVMAVVIQGLARENPKTIFEGRWNSERGHGGGQLRCELTTQDSVHYQGVFSGQWTNRIFEYEVEFVLQKSKQSWEVVGEAKIDRRPYRWQGVLEGDVFKAQYITDATHYHEAGSFWLERKK